MKKESCLLKNKWATVALGFALAALALLNSQPAAVAQGSLSPSGPPMPGMKTLAQIEPRTPIAMAPFTIIRSGSYYLTTNLNVTVGDGILVNANNVTLDLNGFTIASTDPTPMGTGILLMPGSSGITILNGHIAGEVTCLGGVFSGPGFANGITYYGTPPPTGVRVSGVSVSGCLSRGIDCGSLDGLSVVENCTVKTVGNYGIIAGSVTRSAAYQCGTYAITAFTASDCYGYTATNIMAGAVGIFALYTAENCHGQSEGGYGMYVGTLNSGTANNCSGISTGTGFAGGTGLYAHNANNCLGQSDGFSAALSALVANNCYGLGNGTSVGVSAQTANNCYGQSSGYGLWAAIANNCIGATPGGSYGVYTTVQATGCWGVADLSGTGLFSANLAVNCYGSSINGTGLSAYLANSSVGTSVSGIPVNAPFRYNMP